MSRVVRHSLAAVVLTLCLCSCGRDGKVIPKNKFARIYAEMFLAESWINFQSEEVRDRADTTAFYRPILEKYGYDLEDYWASVSHYLQDPDRFSRILKRSNAILSDEAAALQKALDEANEAARRPVEGAEE